MSDRKITRPARQTARRFGPVLAVLALSVCPLLAETALADAGPGYRAWQHKDYATAVRLWQAPAAAGEAEAQFDLGEAYKLGRGVPQDLTRAEQLFGQAAVQGYKPAADRYGVLLYQRGARAQAMPYLIAGAGRGYPLAECALGIAYFNGEVVTADWVKAYAYESLAQQAGVPQARTALAQMDNYIPIAQRQQGVAMSSDLATQIEANRGREMAAADLGTPQPGPAQPTPETARYNPPAQPSYAPPAQPSYAPPAQPAYAPPAPDYAPPQPAYAPPQTAYAPPQPDYAPPPPEARSQAPAPAPRPRWHPRPAAEPAHEPAPRPALAGGWKIQLGAFGVRANADSMWGRVHGLGPVAGHGHEMVASGRVTRLLVTGFSEAGAHAACQRLAGAGMGCIVTRD